MTRKVSDENDVVHQQTKNQGQGAMITDATTNENQNGEITDKSDAKKIIHRNNKT